MSQSINLDYPILLMSIGGIWLPDSVKSKKIKFIYNAYTCFVAIYNAILPIFISIFVVNSVIKNLPVEEYNDTLYISVTLSNALIKLLISGILKKKEIVGIKSLTTQKTFQPVNDDEINLRRRFQIFVR